MRPTLKKCTKHGKPCTCAMGNIYRFAEPVILYMLKQKGKSYGYDLASGMKEHALTDSEIEGAALYRTLRRLEENGYVKSSWDVAGAGPARRTYILTDSGDRHLAEWAEVLHKLSTSMEHFVQKSRQLNRSTRSRTTAAS